MNKIAIGPADLGDESHGFQALSDALGTEAVAINYFERASGESIGDCYHRHHEQEEVFYVISGSATFETEEGDVPVDAGELIRFGPGEWQQGWNYGDARLRVLALGAPRDEGPTSVGTARRVANGRPYSSTKETTRSCISVRSAGWRPAGPPEAGQSDDARHTLYIARFDSRLFPPKLSESTGRHGCRLTDSAPWFGDENVFSYFSHQFYRWLTRTTPLFMTSMAP